MTLHLWRRRQPAARDGFTLIEMIIVILVMLILLALTVAVVGRTMDGDRVRGGARQVQNYLAGARDRAIYAASRIENDDDFPPAVGVRFLPDPEMTNLDPGKLRLVYRSMVFIQEVDPRPTRLTVYREEGPPGVFTWYARQFTGDGAGADVSFGEAGGEPRPNAAGSLVVRGLIPGDMESGVFQLPVYFDRDASKEPYYVEFTLNDLRQDGSPDPPADFNALASGTWWLWRGTLSKPYFDAASDYYTPQPCRFRVLPSVMPSEEPRLLPRGVVVDGNSSGVGGTSGTLANWRRFDGSFDVMFNSRGTVDGSLAAVGQVHLVVADAEDVERGFRVGSPFVFPDGTPYADPDGDGNPRPADTDGDDVYDERQGDEFIVSVRTQTGSIYSSDINTEVSDPEFSDPSVPTVRSDPFKFADGGGQAR